MYNDEPLGIIDYFLITWTALWAIPAVVIAVGIELGVVVWNLIQRIKTK